MDSASNNTTIRLTPRFEYTPINGLTFHSGFEYGKTTICMQKDMSNNSFNLVMMWGDVGGCAQHLVPNTRLGLPDIRLTTPDGYMVNVNRKMRPISIVKAEQMKEPVEYCDQLLQLIGIPISQEKAVKAEEVKEVKAAKGEREKNEEAKEVALPAPIIPPETIPSTTPPAPAPTPATTPDSAPTPTSTSTEKRKGPIDQVFTGTVSRLTPVFNNGVCAIMVDYIFLEKDANSKDFVTKVKHIKLYGQAVPKPGVSTGIKAIDPYSSTQNVVRCPVLVRNGDPSTAHPMVNALDMFTHTVHIYPCETPIRRLMTTQTDAPSALLVPVALTIVDSEQFMIEARVNGRGKLVQINGRVHSWWQHLPNHEAQGHVMTSTLNVGMFHFYTAEAVLTSGEETSYRQTALIKTENDKASYSLCMDMSQLDVQK